MVNMAVELYSTKTRESGDITPLPLEAHLEYEHKLSYYSNCFDFLGYDTLELIHRLIHLVYFEGFYMGFQKAAKPFEVKLITLYEESLKTNYPFSSLDEDLALVRKGDSSESV